MHPSEILTTFTKSPSYLHSLLNTVDDIILIHKANDPLLNESYDIPTLVKPSNNKDEDNCLDITGSPLKVNLNNSSFLSVDSLTTSMNFWQKHEEKHYPLPYDIAQKYIQEYLNQNYKNEKNLTTWWVLDGTDEDRTILLSALQLPTSISRSVVKLQGYLPKNHPSIVFEALCNKHFEIVGELTGETIKIPLRQLTCNISTTYKLGGSKITATNFDKCDVEGSVYLEISWNQCCAEIPLDHSKSIMTIQTIVGQQSSILSRFWNELILLELYVKSLNEYNSETMLNNDWIPSLCEFSDSSSMIDLIIETVQFCQDKLIYSSNKDDGIGLGLQQIIQHVDKRHTCDITDHLWMILNQCTTYGALTECLNVVFTEVINSDSSFYIAESNKTSMAQIIRDIVAGKTSVFMLTGTQPIEILIDIGLEKLRKDFYFIFTKSNIITEQDLRNLFNTSSGQTADNDLNKKSNNIRTALYHKQSLLNLDYLESRMKVLGQLHTVLENLILVPSFWQRRSSKTIFDHYVGKESPINSFSDLAKDKLYEIQVDLPVCKVCDYIKTLSPVMWRLSLTLSKPSFSVKNVFHLSQNPIFPPIMSRSEVIHEITNDGSEAYYHYTLLTQMINFINRKLV